MGTKVSTTYEKAECVCFLIESKIWKIFSDIYVHPKIEIARFVRNKVKEFE